MAGDAAAAAGPPAEIDTTVSHSARIWNYWLGGKDNYAADREAGDRVAAMLPSIVAQARADRAFLGRAIRYLAAEEGIRQFLDIGTGLPTADNTHEVAQRVAPGSRIVYVDNDPLVLAHARALLTSTPEGSVRLHRRRPAGAGGDPRQGGAHARLRPASGADAAGHLAPYPRHRRGLPDHRAAGGGAGPGQLSWPSTTPPAPSAAPPWRRRWRTGTRSARRR